MKKLTTVVGTLIFIAALFTGTPAFAAPAASTCATSGLSDIPKTDPRYKSGLDGDGDGVMCEGNTASITPPADSSAGIPADIPAGEPAGIPAGEPVGTSTEVGPPVAGSVAGTGTPQAQNPSTTSSPEELASTGAADYIIPAGAALLLLLAGWSILRLNKRP